MTTSLLIGLALAVAAPGPKEPPRKEAASIVGAWEAEKGTAGGQDLPIPPGGVGFEFAADGSVTLREGKRAPKLARYTLDPKKDPAEIDITANDGQPNRGVFAGIYKLDGDTLTMCVVVGPPGTARPTRFESPAGSEARLVVFKRVKKKD